MGLRSRSVSSVAGMGIEHSPAVPFGFYTPRGSDSDRAGGGSGGTTASTHGPGYQDSGGGGHHTDGVLYLGSRGSLADTLPLHIAPRWFSAHSVNYPSEREQEEEERGGERGERGEDMLPGCPTWSPRLLSLRKTSHERHKHTKVLLEEALWREQGPETPAGGDAAGGQKVAHGSVPPPIRTRRSLNRSHRAMIVGVRTARYHGDEGSAAQASFDDERKCSFTLM
ncbi:E3 ubiquitin-protein ligase znrf1 [Takifugu flavidus]|uniref:RING-type E3 ubiquitin transferase n=1 Tax=Takifugu flavidus TaxID=433684 RepID=A0A5C6PD00_9TELE|nr:E3 ubiquitin-protein ligase znrf1 [Takifugu flavidus]